MNNRCYVAIVFPCNRALSAKCSLVYLPVYLLGKVRHALIGCRGRVRRVARKVHFVHAESVGGSQ